MWTQVAKVPLLRVEIVKRSDDMKGFVALPRRRVVERTFSWFGRNRRLAKDFENHVETWSSSLSSPAFSSPSGGLPGRRSAPSVSDRCGFGQGTFVGAPANDRDA